MFVVPRIQGHWDQRGENLPVKSLGLALCMITHGAVSKAMGLLLGQDYQVELLGCWCREIVAE